MLCINVLFTNKVGTDKMVNMMGVIVTILFGILIGISVSMYQESGVNIGVHMMTEHFGPNARHLPTKKDHRQAETTKKIFI